MNIDRRGKLRPAFVAWAAAPLLCSGCTPSTALGPYGGQLHPVDPAAVRAAARYDQTFTYAASAASPVHVGQPVDLTLWLTNTSNRTAILERRRFSDAGYEFTFWVTRAGCQVPVPADRRQPVRRYTAALSTGGPLPADHVPPGGVIESHIDLRSMFQIDVPGRYTVVAEPAVVWEGTSDEDRARGAVKTEFDVVP